MQLKYSAQDIGDQLLNGPPLAKKENRIRVAPRNRGFEFCRADLTCLLIQELQDIPVILGKTK